MRIGVTGYATAGKDTIGEMLEWQGFNRVAFADAVRECVYALNPFIPVEARRFRFVPWFTKVVFIPLQVELDNWGYQDDPIQAWNDLKNDNEEVRFLLQKMGTEVGREIISDNIWIDIAMRKAAAFEDVVFTDVRFENEAKAVHESGGVIWRVDRPGVGPVNGHKSDTGVADIDADTIIDNGAGFGSLELKVLAALEVVGVQPRDYPLIDGLDGLDAAIEEATHDGLDEDIAVDRTLPDGTFYCGACDKRFDSESTHLEVEHVEPDAPVEDLEETGWVPRVVPLGTEGDPGEIGTEDLFTKPKVDKSKPGWELL